MANPDLEKARLRLYDKADRKPAIIATGTVLMVLAGFIAFLNLINSISLGFRADQRPIERFLFWLIVATLGFIGPYGFFLAKKQREIKQIERRLPDFLRDVAEAGRFGMTLADAIVVSGGGRYGKLTPEIKKMAAQITWGVRDRSPPPVRDARQDPHGRASRRDHREVLRRWWRRRRCPDDGQSRHEGEPAH